MLREISLRDTPELRGALARQGDVKAQVNQYQIEAQVRGISGSRRKEFDKDVTALLASTDVDVANASRKAELAVSSDRELRHRYQLVGALKTVGIVLAGLCFSSLLGACFYRPHRPVGGRQLSNNASTRGV